MQMREVRVAAKVGERIRRKVEAEDLALTKATLQAEKVMNSLAEPSG